jgi:Flp pilus assembly protein TadD
MAHNYLGISFARQGRWDEAEASLRCAVGLKPDHRRAHNNLGLVLARTGRGTEALVCFRNAGCSPTDAHTNLAYGLTYRRPAGA